MLVACTGATSPLGTLTGTWSAYSQPVPGSSQTVTITQRGDQISGSGTYVLEAGSSGGFEVSGTYQPPNVTLRLARGDGLVFEFSGAVTDGHMVGVETFPAGQVTDTVAYSFTKQ